MHTTVLTKGKCENLLKEPTSKCPFCKYTSMPPMVHYHIKNHLQLAVTHLDFTIVKCNLNCRPKSHFHCCYCSKTVIRRAQLLMHIANHSIKSSPNQPETPFTLQPQMPTALQPKTPDALQPQTLVILQPGTPASLQPGTPAALQPRTPASLQPRTPASLQPRTPASLQPRTPASLQSRTPTIQQPEKPAAQLSQLPDTLQPESDTVPQPQSPALLPKHSAKRTVTCSQCNLTLLAKNLRVHIARRHTDIEKHFQSQCIDCNIGIFAVQKAFHSQATPIHVIKNTWDRNQRSECELEECNLSSQFAPNSGILPSECCHVKSLSLCPEVDHPNVTVTENSLSQLVQQKCFGEARKAQLLLLQQQANTAFTPLSVHVTVGGLSSKYFISVFEPEKSYYSRMGRVMVAFEKNKNSWYCPCAKPRQSCIHKDTAKWHLFQMLPELFKNILSSEEVFNTGACHD
ncbi:uncharacterized protein LOC130546013 [Triplophysa rosa]|uniref:C2H2-type domain-containing protein n=1 Tax=Triplophysa rosa TaxID=992332 RepID=A0A9W7TA16_TRIRA|nr:uncharacterized protein LOC130546013 [Triplophysa rosa]KAI7793400.1 hypothetical protein IRJ41_016145 [Triplophysa rosa]